MQLEVFDRIIYINLDRREDRRKSIEDLLLSLAPKEKIERFAAIEHENGSIGCALSHIEVLRNIKKRGYARVLVVEDDIEINDETSLENIGRLVKIESDVLLLSANVIERHEFDETVYRITESQTTAAYSPSQSVLDSLIAKFEESVELLSQGVHPDLAAIDQNWKTLQKSQRWLGTLPMPFRQTGGYSDIEKREVDYRC